MRDSERRRLSAIVAVDVAGFSRMMSADEIGTVVLLRALWGEVLHPQVPHAAAAKLWNYVTAARIWVAWMSCKPWPM